ncbi:hypothetical protein AS593_12730 [Caulobacter vibrioides]|nr:hypothetical protein AS593_12730 [Caulobacter vibrioides]
MSMAGFVSSFALLAAAAGPAGLVNPDFETAGPDAAPSGWRVGGPGYVGQRTTDRPGQGEAAARLAFTGEDRATAEYGTLSQGVAAQAYRGRRIRLSGVVRSPAGGASLWLRIDGPGGKMLSLDNMDGRAVRSDDWTRVEILADVPAGAERLALGLLQRGAGEAFVDAVALEDIGPANPGAETARALTARETANLAAFARAFGYVRYFYAGDTAAGADWNAVALAGVQSVEKANSPAELAARLEAVLKPLAPELQLWPTAATAPAPIPVLPGPGLRWRHEGVGITPGGVYRSARVPATVGGETDRFAADLPGGISLRLPLAIAAAGVESAPKIALDKPAGFLPSGDDRTTRLADVVLTWNVFQHFYPYFDVTPVDWSAELPRALAQASAAPDAEAFGQDLRRLVADLDDGHGRVSGPGETPQGQPPLRLDWIENQAVVTAVAPGAPLKVGDVVLRIDGRSTSEALAARERLISSATPQYKRHVASRLLVAGPVGAPTTLEGVRADGAPFSISLERQARPVPPLAKPEPIAEIRPGVLYVDLDRVSDAQLQEAVPRLAAARGVVFDVRGYPRVKPWYLGLLADRPLRSDLWNVPVTLRPDRQDVTWKTSNWTLPPRTPRLTGKVAFVTDGQAISYAESTLGLVAAEKLAPIVGEPTAGTNGNINPFELPGGYRISWTGMKVTKADGGRHHGVGVQPTVLVRPTLAGVRAGRDEQLEAALDLVAP